ncbi:MAG: AMP-dependent synthetase [Acidobacteria bacterium RIFCSPLOWO2_02_FULL_68_18]|nr:MAG: AMP-dependent synthetase [Acidobacteria bacterium RIFCSPLOWO2_02_FULL_68_18]
MKPWLAHYDADVAASVAPYPDKTLLDYLSTLAREHGSETALLFKGASMSYRQLEVLSDGCAAALAALGVRPGDRVALLLPNCPQFFIAQFGTWKAGGIVVPLNPIYTERELESALTSSGASTVVALTPFYGRIKNIQARAGVRLVIATSIKEYLPPVLRLLFGLFREKKDGHRIVLAAGDVWLHALLDTHRSSQKPAVTVRPDDRAVILSSGGTTGTPKGAVGLHRHYVAAGRQLYEWTKSALTPPSDVIMLPLPLFHVYANVGVQPLAFIAPAPLAIVPNPRDIGDLLKTIRQVKPAFFNGIPTLYTAILNHPDVRAGKVSLRSIRLCFSGAAALMEETKRRFEEATGARIIEGYSLTEGMMACCVNPVKGPNKIGSIGLPLPDVEARIVDPERSERELPFGEVGELLLRAPQHMAEYWNNPNETAAALQLHGEGGPWVHTGDLAYMDEEGYIFLVDRKKDMLKTSGFQVWPREIEEVLSAHPAVMEASVAGIPHPLKGEVPKAWVVLEAGQSATEDELRAFCRERLAPYKAPAAIEFRTDLPKTMVGKVLRRVLVSEHRQ